MRWLTAAAIVLSLLLCLILVDVSPKTAFYMLPTRMWEFLLGARIAWLSAARASRLRERFGASAGDAALPLLLLAVPLLPILPNAREYLYGHPSIAALAVTLLTAAVILFGPSARVERGARLFGC